MIYGITLAVFLILAGIGAWLAARRRERRERLQRFDAILSRRATVPWGDNPDPFNTDIPEFWNR